MTVNREDYLKTIYELGGEDKKIGTKNIATVLKVSPPSVSEMIKILVREEYVEYELYKGVILTLKGLEKAKIIKRRHLLWEVFLAEKLGYGQDDVHDEAEILEHVTSAKLEEKFEFAEKSLLFHVFNHEGDEDEQVELGVDSVQSHINWDKAFLNKIMSNLKAKKKLYVEDGVLRLTDEGRAFAIKSYEEIVSEI